MKIIIFNICYIYFILTSSLVAQPAKERLLNLLLEPVIAENQENEIPDLIHQLSPMEVGQILFTCLSRKEAISEAKTQRLCLLVDACEHPWIDHLYERSHLSDPLSLCLNAIANGHTAIAEALLNKGADIFLAIRNGYTPLNCMFMTNHKAVRDLVFERLKDQYENATPERRKNIIQQIKLSWQLLFDRKTSKSTYFKGNPYNFNQNFKAFLTQIKSFMDKKAVLDIFTNQHQVIDVFTDTMNLPHGARRKAYHMIHIKEAFERILQEDYQEIRKDKIVILPPAVLSILNERKFIFDTGHKRPSILSTISNEQQPMPKKPKIDCACDQNNTDQNDESILEDFYILDSIGQVFLEVFNDLMVPSDDSIEIKQALGVQLFKKLNLIATENKDLYQMINRALIEKMFIFEPYHQEHDFDLFKLIQDEHPRLYNLYHLTIEQSDARFNPDAINHGIDILGYNPFDRAPAGEVPLVDHLLGWHMHQRNETMNAEPITPPADKALDDNRSIAQLMTGAPMPNVSGGCVCRWM